MFLLAWHSKALNSSPATKETLHMADENIKILSDATFEPWVIESTILERKYVSSLIK